MIKILINSIFFFTIIISQNTSYRFDYYDISNGLSQNQANAIYQSHDGYIYVGSQGGLDRFDGYNFKYFSHNPADTTTIPYGWVNAITEDSRNNLWIGTNQKNVGYLKSDGSWTRIKLKGMENWDRDGRAWWWGFISDIKPYEDKVIISSNGNGLFIVGDNYEKHYTSNQKGINVITEIFVVDKRIFVATVDGLYEFDMTKEEFIKTRISSSVNGFTKNDIAGQFYVSTDNKIFTYNYQNNSINELNIKTNIKNRAFKKMVLHNKKLWILNENYGIIVHNISNESSVELTPPSIKSKENVSMVVDKDNTIWIGTSGYGIMKYDPGKQKFNLYSKEFPTSNSLGFDVAWGANIDKNGDYWTGKAEPQGEIVRIDRDTGKIKRYLQSNDPKSWFFNFVQTNDGMLVWKGYPGRAKTYWLKYNYNTDEFVEVDFFTLFPDSIRGSWGQTRDNRTFALTSKGIKIYNGKSFKLNEKLNSNFTDNKFPLFDYSVQNNIVYMREPTTPKLYRWNTTTDEIKSIYESETFKRDVSQQSYIVYNDSLIFITTYGFGLVEINIEKNTKRFITVSDGLPSQHLYEGYLDNDNNIWISSNYGIFSYNPEDKSVKSYLVADGLQDMSLMQTPRISPKMEKWCLLELEDSIIFILKISYPNQIHHR